MTTSTTTTTQTTLTNYIKYNNQKMTTSTTTTQTTLTNYIFIDGSYFVFHRYFSLSRWWKLSHPEENNDNINFTDNPDFIDKFKKTFIDSLNTLEKKLKIKSKEVTIIVGKDCHRENIWRKQYYKQYKGTRQKNDDIAYFMKLAYEELYFTRTQLIINHPQLEADDCIALYVKKLIQLDNICTTNIYIITSDKDYLQLVTTDHIYLFDLAFKDLTKQKSSYGSAEKDLFCKIVMGDPSDNISSVFTKCGPKTAVKYYENQSLFREKLEKDENANNKWILNRILVDFNYIPEHLCNEFIHKYNP
jgi:5'-3' exonuclease